MDFNYSTIDQILPLITQNVNHIIVLLCIIIVAIKIVLLFVKDTYVLVDMTKTEWSRDIPKHVMYEESEIPPDNLTGWVPLFHSTEVKPNQIKSAEFCGNDLVVFRSSSGKVQVLDAYCPHMGTYLPIGKVVDDSIRCPFHGWTFNREGQCNHVPGLDDSSLPKAKVKVWLSVETNGLIYLWYDSNNEEPTWMPHHIDGIEKRRFAGIFKLLCNGYFVDVPINIADYVHFTTLHSPPDFIPVKSLFHQTLFARVATKLIYFEYKMVSKRGPEHNQYEFVMNISLYIFGIRVLSGLKNCFLFDGPYTAYSGFTCWPLNQMNMIVTYTPLPGRKFKVTNYAYAKPNILGRVIATLILKFNIFVLYRDAVIFSGKKWISSPYYIKCEKDHATLNKWFHQFYPKECKLVFKAINGDIKTD